MCSTIYSQLILRVQCAHLHFLGYSFRETVVSNTYKLFACWLTGVISLVCNQTFIKSVLCALNTETYFLLL